MNEKKPRNGPDVLEHARERLGKHARLCLTCRTSPRCKKGQRLAAELRAMTEPDT